MFICPTCKNEMTCKKNGVFAVWHESHARAGDLYACDKCGSEMLHCETAAFHLSPLQYASAKKHGDVIDMV